MLYPILKWLHILAAITAVGANITYGIWLRQAARKPEALGFTLRGIKTLDDRVANPAYGALLITGLLMIFVGRLSLTVPWLLTSLVLYVAVVLVGMLAYTPTLRRQIEVAESQGPGSEEYARLSRQGTRQGIAMAVIVVVISFLMVVKPGLWG